MKIIGETYGHPYVLFSNKKTKQSVLKVDSILEYRVVPKCRDGARLFTSNDVTFGKN
ncbi:unnamed protein product [Brugia timori]|uniref:Transposase n=1 Tax=Brugia timori TaxID=42155 RepID=A0A0R3QFL1_9BILA|nr:unnamed protein product [Brugia timori]